MNFFLSINLPVTKGICNFHCSKFLFNRFTGECLFCMESYHGETCNFLSSKLCFTGLLGSVFSVRKATLGRSVTFTVVSSAQLVRTNQSVRKQEVAVHHVYPVIMVHSAMECVVITAE